MYKSLVFVFSFMLTILVSGQEFNKIVVDTSINREVLIGFCTREGLQGEVFGGMFENEYTAYIPNPETLSQLTEYTGTFDVLIVLGSWCGDTREQLPRFLKIMDMIGVDETTIQMIAVDTAKMHGKLSKEPAVKLDIKQVPIFIIYSGETEFGRIIETPEETLETDLLKIFENI